MLFTLVAGYSNHVHIGAFGSFARTYDKSWAMGAGFNMGWRFQWGSFFIDPIMTTEAQIIEQNSMRPISVGALVRIGGYINRYIRLYGLAGGGITAANEATKDFIWGGGFGMTLARRASIFAEARSMHKYASQGVPMNLPRVLVGIEVR